MDIEKLKDAEKKLSSAYDLVKANMLLGTFLKFKLYGENYLLENMARQTFWRHRRWIMLAGVEWDGRIIRPRSDSKQTYY